MKKLIILISFIFFSQSNFAQQNLNDLLAAGVNDAKRFSEGYLLPATNGLAYGISSGWFNNAKTPKKYGFELSIIGNTSFIKDENKVFEMKTEDYTNIEFPNDIDSQNVATALGHNNPDITVLVTYDGEFGLTEEEVELTLPTGIGSSNVNLIPTAFLQGSFTLFEGTQIKGRFFPKVETEDVKIGLYGIGIQQEFTTWLPEDSNFPLAISGLVSYTHLDANYDFTNTEVVDGENQQVQTNVNSLLFQLIAGTNFKVLNFYGAVGYLSATSETDLLGTYRVSDGILFSEEIIDPFSVDSKTNGVTATLGANVKAGFFGINASYTLADFDTASLGINFMF